MRIDRTRASATFLTLLVATLTACRAGTPRSTPTDSAKSSTRTDTASASPTPEPTTRADSVVLRTDKSQYRAGEKMTLTLENKSGSSYTFNPCFRSLQREEGNRWTELEEAGRMCTMEAWVLDPHGTRTGTTEVPSSLSPGRYRVVVRLTPEQPAGAPAAGVVAVSDAIMVSQ
jgi:Big-like domain-containing protein